VLLIVLVLGGLSCSRDNADIDPLIPGNRKSPISISSVKYEGTYMKVVYGQPYRRNRTIFGEWEPFGEVWRTGANEATEITVTEPVFMGSEVVLAGTYALFTIPYEDRWTIILNRDLGQWGAFEYNPDSDYLRFDVPVTTLETPQEAFTIEFSDPFMDQTTMMMSWDLIKVEVPIRFYGE
jgi:hypothetical protein